MLKRKVDSGATRAITQFFFDNDDFERYVETWEAAGVKGQIDGGNLMERQRRRDATIMTEAWVVEGGKPVLRSIPWNDPRAQQFLNTFLPALYKRLQELGWTKKYVQGIMDEPNQWEIPAFLDAAAKVRKLMPGVRTIRLWEQREQHPKWESTEPRWSVGVEWESGAAIEAAKGKDKLQAAAADPAAKATNVKVDAVVKRYGLFREDLFEN